MANLSTLIAPYKKVPLNGFNGILLDLQNPVGVTNATFLPFSEGALLVEDKSKLITRNSLAPWNLGTDGYCSPKGAWYTYASHGANTLTPAAGYARKYEVWGRTKNAALTADQGVRILFNVATQWTDYWELNLAWIPGNVFRLSLVQVAAGVVTMEGVHSFSTIVDEPAHYHMTLVDYGDTIVAMAHMWEGDNIVDDEAISLAYTVGSRPAKTAMRYYFTDFNGNVLNEWFIRGCRVQDFKVMP